MSYTGFYKHKPDCTCSKDLLIFLCTKRGFYNFGFIQLNTMHASSYATVSAPPEALQGQGHGKPVFVMHNNIPGDNRVELEEMYKSVNKSVNTKDIHGIQKIGGLWRLYIEERQNRIKLITDGIQIRDTTVRVYDKNPYLPHESENAFTCLDKRHSPFSARKYHLRRIGGQKICKINGHVIYPKLRV